MLRDTDNVEEGMKEASVRPNLLDDFIGQSALKNNLKIFLSAAKHRMKPLDHVLFYGPPGLGKTTLSHIISHEMQSDIKTTSGPMLSKGGDLAALLTNLQPMDVLFIDEIHRMNVSVEEILYSAMEECKIDIMIGEGVTARSIRIDVAPFTLVGATTRLGLLTAPLRDRFGIVIKLDFYTADELCAVIERCAKLSSHAIQREAAMRLAVSSRGTPRIALRLFRRICDFAIYSAKTVIDMDIVEYALSKLYIDPLGLDELDYKYLNYIMDYYAGGPVGIDTISAAISEDKGTVEDTVEPFLLQIGFLQRTPRGRQLTIECTEHLKKHLKKSKAN